MELIKRYVYAVTKRLPEKQRDEVSRELLSDIEAMVNDRSKGKKLTEAYIRDVLLELGNPAVFAEQYSEGKKYLIGPPLYDTYLTLLRTILLVVPSIVALLTLIEGLLNFETVGKLIVETAGAAIEVGVHIFVWVTLIFVLLERVGVKQIGKPSVIEPEAWTPDDLPDLPKENRIAKSDAINGVVWSSVVLLWLVWQIPAVHAIIPLHIPLFFSESMWPYWTLGLLVVTILMTAVEIVRLARGVWDALTVVLLTVSNMIIVGYLVALAIFVRPIMNEAFVQNIVRATGGSEWIDILYFGGIVLLACIVGQCVYEIVIAWRGYQKGRKEK